MEEPTTFYIREKWHLHFMGNYETEIHDEKTDPGSNKVTSMKAVKKFIRDWLESWLDNAQDGGHKFLGGETDFKTYARCKIRNESRYVDNFELKVVDKRVQETAVYRFSPEGRFEKTARRV